MIKIPKIKIITFLIESWALDIANTKGKINFYLIIVVIFSTLASRTHINNVGWDSGDQDFSSGSFMGKLISFRFQFHLSGLHLPHLFL